MYENLYYYYEEIDDKMIWVLIKPNFREAITIFNGLNKVLSDGEVSIKGEFALGGDVNQSRFPEVSVSEDAQWALEMEGARYVIYITELTEKITTYLGEEWNDKFNKLIKECKSEYWRTKKKEIRLYFYEASNDKLQLCNPGNSCTSEAYNYPVERRFPTQPYCSIDKKYVRPEKDCFILGRVRKTIGLKDSKLLDFIEPVYQISLDFKKGMYDFCGYKYAENKEKLEKILFKLLKISIAKKCDKLQMMRIRTYLQKNTDEQDILIAQFRNEIWKAFKENDIEKVRNLYKILNEPQDCTNVRFELRLKEEKTYEPDKSLIVYFVNGEVDWLSVKWIYQNIHNCIDAKGEYLGKMRNRYNFY